MSTKFLSETSVLLCMVLFFLDFVDVPKFIGVPARQTGQSVEPNCQGKKADSSIAVRPSHFSLSLVSSNFHRLS